MHRSFIRSFIRSFVRLATCHLIIVDLELLMEWIRPAMPIGRKLEGSIPPDIHRVGTCHLEKGRVHAQVYEAGRQAGGGAPGRRLIQPLAPRSRTPREGEGTE